MKLKHLALNSDLPLWDATAQANMWLHALTSTVDGLFHAKSIIPDTCTVEILGDKSSVGADSSQSIIGAVSNSVAAWFNHPSDAFLLGCALTKQDPCSWKGQADAILLRPASVMVLNRRNDRRILNAPAVGEVVQRLNQRLQAGKSSGRLVFTAERQKDHYVAKNGTSTSDIFVHDIEFEGKSLRQQADLMRSTDVLITVHGAAETNIAWLPPCAVVLEVYPWGFYFDFFRYLASSSGVLKYMWQESRANTVAHVLHRKQPECVDIIERNILEASKPETFGKLRRVGDMLRAEWHTAHAALRNASSDKVRISAQKRLAEADAKVKFEKLRWMPKPSDDHDVDANFAVLISRVCIDDLQCRSCVRGADGVRLNVTLLEKILVSALRDRESCLANHPFLSKGAVESKV